MPATAWASRLRAVSIWSPGSVTQARPQQRRTTPQPMAAPPSQPQALQLDNAAAPAGLAALASAAESISPPATQNAGDTPVMEQELHSCLHVSHQEAHAPWPKGRLADP